MEGLRTLLDHLSSEVTGNPVKFLQNNLVPEKVNVYFDNNKIDKPRRCILYSRFPDKRPDSYFCLNGTIIDRDEYKLICQPPMSFYRINTTKLDLTKYHIFPAKEGTLLNLYYHKDKWHISTSREYFAGTRKGLYGTKNYSQVLEECLPESFDWNSLDKNKSYTVGVAHPAIHPARKEKEIWFVSSFDVSKFNSGDVVHHDYFDNIGIPLLQEEKEIDADRCRGSIKNYLDNGEMFYGYVLRSKDEDATEEKSSVLYKSSLLNAIESIFYTRKHNDEIIQNGYDRLEFMKLSAFIKGSDLFPKLTETKFDDLITSVAETVTYISSLKNGKTVGRESAEERLAHDLFTRIKDFITENNAEVISQMILVPDYLYTFANHLLTKN
jgi:hypothetical protein